MDLGRPYADVIPGPRGRVLSVLVQLATPVTVRALAARAGVSPQGALIPALMALMAWGDRWTTDTDGPPLLLRHTSCGHDTQPTVACSHCAQPITHTTITAHTGPGARAESGTAVIAGLLHPPPRRPAPPVTGPPSDRHDEDRDRPHPGFGPLPPPAGSHRKDAAHGSLPG